MLRTLVVIVFLSMCFACSRTVYVPASSTTRIIDTIVEQTMDSSIVKALFACDSNNQVILRDLYEARSSQAQGGVEIDSGGRIEVITRWKTQYIDRIKEVRDTTTVIEVREVEKVVKYVPKIFWYTMAFSIVMLVFLGIRLYNLI